MGFSFKDYKIHIVNSSNFPDKFVAYIEELHNVIEIIESKDQAEEVLKEKFEKEINRLKAIGQQAPIPGSGKAKVTFASNDKIENLRPLIDDFWSRILGTSYSTSFVSDDSYFRDWEHYLENGKEELIRKVKLNYSVDITPIYNRPIHEILLTIKNKSSFFGRLRSILRKK